MKKILFIILTIISTTSVLANQPKEWQLGFQNPASDGMRDIVNFHDNLLLPIIIAISVFVLFLMIYACVRFRASRNPNPSKTTHNVAVEVLWTLIPCLILIVMAVPSFKILYKQDTIPKAEVTIKAIGYQWYWGYEYPDENIIFESYMIKEEDLKENQPRLLAVDNEVVVPVNKVVKVLITANDVLHAWALPSFGVKRDAVEVTIKAIGYQWYWGYEYPDENIIFESYMIKEEDLKENQPRLLAVDNEVVVPVNKVVKVLITANDVLHAWALPSFGVKRDAVPGRINETWFKAEKVGTYYGQCSELCGIQHAFMPITVRVVTDEEYEVWLTEAKMKFAKEPILENEYEKLASK